MKKERYTSRLPPAREGVVRAPTITDWHTGEALRKLEVAFITDRLRRGVDYWWETLAAEVMSVHTARKHAEAGRWAQRRDEWWEGVQQEVLHRERAHAVHDRVTELNALSDLRAAAVEAVMPRMVDGKKVYPIKPTSMEGVMRAIVAIDARIEKKRENIITLIEPELQQLASDGAEGAIVAGGVIFSPEEMRDVARMLLERRRAQQQQRIAAARSRTNGSGTESDRGSDQAEARAAEEDDGDEA